MNRGSILTEQHRVRLTREHSELLKKIAKFRACNPSYIIRLALLEFFARNSYLTAEEKKGIGIREAP